MKKSKGVTALTIVCMLMASVLTLFAAGCIDYSPSLKEVDLAEASPGETLTYLLHIENAGDEASNNTVVTDPIDAHLDEVGNITGGGVYDPGEHKITWNLGTVPAYGEFNFSFTARIIPSTPIGTVISNTASIVYDGGGPHTSEATQTTVVAPDPLDHFEFETISSPQTEDQPFAVTIYAKDASGQTIEDFEDTANLSDLSGTINPIVTRNTYTALDAGSHHSLSVNCDGTLWAWGKNDQGQTDVLPGTDYVAVSGGANHSLALRSDGTLAGWGYDNQGQATPPTDTDFTAVAAGGFHSLALHEDGTLSGWGENYYGQATVPTDEDFIAVSAGLYHSLALHEGGTLEAWGLDNNGQVSNTPTDGGYVAISAGAYHCLAMKADGTIIGWGYNDHGQAASPPADNYVAISAGNYHSLALRANGTLYAWGNDSYGQITDVPDGDNYTAISAGDHHCLALRDDGIIVAWGYNGYGQTDVPQGHFTAGVFTGAVSIGSAYSSNVITAEHDGKSGSSNAFDVAALLPDFSTSSKLVDMAEAVPQDILGYDIHVENTGAGAATQTTVVDYLDANLENVADITAGGVYDSGEHKITWDLGTLNSQGQQDMSFSAQVKASAAPGAVISNQAQIYCAEAGPFSTNTTQSTVIPGPVDHFAIADIASPQTAGVSFPLAITALDAFGNTATSFSGSVTISDTTGTIAPTLSGAFTDGVWSGDAVIGQAESACTVSVDDGAGHLGQSNSFEVEADTTYPDAEITYPTEGEVLSDLSVMVTGTAYDQTLASWQLSYRLEGSSDWVPLSDPHTNPVQNGDLETWDLSPLGDGIVHLKLTVTDMGELTSEDIVSVVIERQDPIAEITWPQDGTLVGGSAQITGSATDGNILRYLVSYGEGASPTDWHPIPPYPSENDDSAYQLSWDSLFNLYAGDYRDLAQTFRVTNGYIDRIDLKLQRTGSGDAEIGLKICEVVSGIPTFNVVAESTTTYRISEIATDAPWYPFEFRGEQLQPDTDYCIVLYRLDGEVDSSNYVSWRRSADDEYAYGSAWVYYNGTWTSWSDHYDFAFIVNTYSEEEFYGYEEISGDVLATWETAETPDGPHVIKLEVEDAYGKQASAQVLVETDRTKPAAQITSPQYGGHVRGTAEITGTAADAHFLKYQLFYGAGVEPPDIPITPETTSPVTDGVLGNWDTTAVDDGLYTLLLKVYDQATLISETTVQVTVDNTDPTAAITSPASGDAACGMLYIQGTASDTNFASYALRYTQDANPDDPNALWTEITSDNLPPGTNLGSLDTMGLAEIRIWLELSVSDEAGNISVVRADVYPDNTFPEAYFDSPWEGMVCGDVRISGVAYDKNVVSYSLYDWDGENLITLLEDVPGGTGTGPEDLLIWDTDREVDPVSDGEHILALEVTDKVGHKRTVIRPIWVDNIPPSGTIQILGKGDGGEFTNTGFVELKIDAHDAEYIKIWNYDEGNPDYIPDDAFLIKAGEGSYTGILTRRWVLSSTLFPAVEEVKEVRCRFIDSAGTESDTYSDTIIYEVAKPNIGNIESPTPQSTIEDGLVAFRFPVYDPSNDPALRSGLDKVEIWLSAGGAPLELVYEEQLSGADCDITADVDLVNRGYGYHDFIIKVFDKAGNSNASNNISCYYSGLAEWQMEGYDLKNSHHNAGIKPGEMLWPYSRTWTTVESSIQDPVMSGGFIYLPHLGDEESKVYKVDPTSEQEDPTVASFTISDPSDFIIKGICVAAGKVYVVTQYNLRVLDADNLSLIGGPYPVSDYASSGWFMKIPVAVGDQILLTTTWNLVAVNATDPSQQIWNRTFEGNLSRPVITDGKIVITEGGRLRTLDTATGGGVLDIVLWTDDDDYTYKGVPSIYNGRIYVKFACGTNSYIRVIRIEPDALVKESETVNRYKIAAQITCANGIFYFTTTDTSQPNMHARLYAFDAATCSQLWVKDVEHFGYGTFKIGTPSVAGGLIYVSYAGKDSSQFDKNWFYFRVYDAYSGHLRWQSPEIEIPAGYPIARTPIITDGKVVITINGSTLCYVPEYQVDDLNALGFDTFCGFYEGINTSLGSFTQEMTDVSLPGRGIDIDFKRTYNSYKPEDGYTDNGLGYGWDYSYNIYIEEEYEGDSLTTLKVHRGDGRVDTYTVDGDTFEPPPGVFDDLVSGRFDGMGSDPSDPEYNTLYTLKVPGGNLWEFDERGDEIRLVRIVDDHGANDNILTLDYEKDGVVDNKVDEIIAPGGGDIYRCLFITWDGDHISQVAYKNVKMVDEQPQTYTISVGYAYDGAKLWRVIDIYGATTEYTYYDDDRMESIATPERLDVFEVSQTISYYGDEDANAGMVSQTTDALGHGTTFSYATAAHMTIITNDNEPIHYTTTHRYDTLYRLIQETNNAGESTIYSYGDDGNGKSLRDPMGRVTQFTSEEGLVKRIISPDGGIREFNYDERDRLTSETDGAEHTKTYEYDDNNNLEKLIDFDQSETLFFYTDESNPGLPTVKVMPRVNGEPEQGEDAKYPTMVYSYNAYGDLVWEALYSDWNENSEAPGADGILAYINSYVYKMDGRIETERLGKPSPLEHGITEYEYTYDDTFTSVLRSVTKQNVRYDINVGEDTLNPTEITRYDKDGRLVQVLRSRGDEIPEPDILWDITQYSYYKDDREWTKSIFTSNRIDPLSGGSEYYYSSEKAYYANGLLKEETDYEGNTTHYNYDNAGRLVEEMDAENRVTSYEYFADGQLKKRTDPYATGSVTYAYDEAGRLSCEEQRFTSALYGEMKYRTERTYDTRGNVTSEKVIRPVPDPTIENLNALTYRVAETTYAHDAKNRVYSTTSITEGGNIITAYEYDPMGNKIEEVLDSSWITEWTYNAQGKAELEVHACTYGDTTENTVIHRTYDALGNTTAETVCDSIEDEANVYSHQLYTYNGLSKVETVSAAVGTEAEGFSLGTYNDIGDTILIASYEYFCDGLLSAETRNNTNPGGTSPAQNVTYSYDPLDNKTMESWDRGDGVSFVKSFEYDGAGNLIKEAVGDGDVERATNYTYDGANRVVEMIQPQADGHTTKYEYSDAERKVRVTDPEGRTAINTLDDLGRVETSEIPGEDGSLILRAYDQAGSVIRESSRQQRVSDGDDLFHEAFQRFDDLGRLTEKRVLSEDEGAQTMLITSFDYDAAGNLISTTTPAGNTSSYYYDTLNRLRRQVLPHGDGIDIVTSYAYDTLGRKTHTYEGDVDPDVTRYTYDGLSHLRQVEQWTEHWTGNSLATYTAPGDPDATTTYEVDLTGNLISQTDARNITTSYSYNACGWATGKTDPLGHSESFTYTDYGESETHTYILPDPEDPDRIFEYTYDGRGRLTSEIASDGDNALDEIAYSYDYANNMTQALYKRADGVDIDDRQIDLAYDSAARLTSVDCALGGTAGAYSTTYEYLDSGELASRTLTGLQIVTSNYTYDISGRLTSSSDSVSGDSFTYDWNPDSLLERVDLPDSEGYMEYTYYGEGLTDTQAAYDSTGTLQASYDYDYYGTAKRESVIIEMTDSPYSQINGEYSYTYDGMGRLTGFDAPETANDINYEYDKAGNLLTKTTYTGPETYQYNDANQISSGPDGTYYYDDFGNLEKVENNQEEVVKSYGYDGFGRLVSYVNSEDSQNTKTVSLSYDPMGRLYERGDGTVDIAFRYDGTSLSQSQVTDKNGNALSTYALSPSGTHLAQDKQGELSYLGLNPHTDVSFTLNDQGNLTGARVYDPYGNLLGGSLDSSLGYQEDYEDPLSGLVWMGARWYSPGLTRFLSVDPVTGDMVEPLDRNLYLYCSDDPINKFDPSGKSSEMIVDSIKSRHESQNRPVYQIPEGNYNFRKPRILSAHEYFLYLLSKHPRLRAWHERIEARTCIKRFGGPGLMFMGMGGGDGSSTSQTSTSQTSTSRQDNEDTTAEGLAEMVNFNNDLLESLGIPSELLPDVTPGQMEVLVEQVEEDYNIEVNTVEDLFVVAEVEGIYDEMERELGRSLDEYRKELEESGLGRIESVLALRSGFRETHINQVSDVDGTILDVDMYIRRLGPYWIWIDRFEIRNTTTGAKLQAIHNISGTIENNGVTVKRWGPTYENWREAEPMITDRFGPLLSSATHEHTLNAGVVVDTGQGHAWIFLTNNDADAKYIIDEKMGNPPTLSTPYPTVNFEL